MENKAICIKTFKVPHYEDSPYIEGQEYEYRKHGNFYHINIPGWSSIVCRFSRNGAEDSIPLQKYFKTGEDLREDKIKELLDD